MAKKITVIEPFRDDIRVLRKKKLRVCAYVRVSTGSDAQAKSFITMLTYYTELIENNPEWEFVGIYADEAITGTRVDKRDEFQAMMQECENGNIDLIVTKTVTRFGRNTLETLQAKTRINKECSKHSLKKFKFTRNNREKDGSNLYALRSLC